MAAIVRHYHKDSTAGGDGTTSATTGANRAYASWSEFVTAEAADLTGTGNHLELHVHGTGAVNEQWVIQSSDGWAFSENECLIIIVDEASRHDGTPQSGFYLSYTGDFDGVVEIYMPDVIIEGLDVENTGSFSTRGFLIQDDSGKTILHSCIAKAPGTAFDNVSASFDGILHAFCLAYDSAIGFSAPDFRGGAYINCSAPDCTTSFTRAGTSGSTKPFLKNCVSIGATTPYSTPLTSYFDTASCSNNATDDTVTTDVPGSSAVANIVSGDFTDTANDNWSLTSGSNLADVGANASSDLSAYNRTIYTVPLVDLFGGVVPQNTNWDIGCSELSSSGSTYNVTMAESVTPSETITESGIFIVSSVESNSQTDSQTENAIINVTVSETNDSLEITGEVSVIFESSAESVDISEVLNGSAVVLSDQDETNSQTDSQTETAILNSVISETNNQNDVTNETALIGSAQTESNVVNSSTEETSILIDSQSESVTPGETIEGSSGTFGAMLESNNISESISETALLNSAIVESNNQVDTISKIVIALSTISESQQVNETLLEQAVFNVSVSESNANTESVNGSSDNIGQISESNTISETILETSVLNAIISETNDQQDIIISTGLFNRTVSESQSGNDIQVGTGSFVVNVSESNQITMLTNGTIGIPDKVISTLTITADYHVINITAKH